MKTRILSAFIISIMLISCNAGEANSKVDEAIQKTPADAGLSINSNDKEGTFSFDGKEVSAKVETQYFGDKVKGNFSVLCQHEPSDDPTNADFELLQVTFINENDATTNTNLKIYKGGSVLPATEPVPGSVSVSLSGVGNGFTDKQFTGSSKSTGTISVSNKTLTLKDVVLFDTDGEKRTVNATMPL